jgi:hypothetical protein
VTHIQVLLDLLFCPQANQRQVHQEVSVFALEVVTVAAVDVSFFLLGVQVTQMGKLEVLFLLLREARLLHRAAPSH